jgi:ABC-type sugar transport system substrate-binding protein
MAHESYFATGSAAIDHSKGVHETLKGAGAKYEIVAEQTSNWSCAESLTVTQNVLTLLGYVPVAIVAANDDMALGVLAAIQQAGLCDVFLPHPLRKVSWTGRSLVRGTRDLQGVASVFGGE